MNNWSISYLFIGFNITPVFIVRIIMLYPVTFNTVNAMFSMVIEENILNNKFICEVSSISVTGNKFFG